MVERGEMVKMSWLNMGRGLNCRGGKAVNLVMERGKRINCRDK